MTQPGCNAALKELVSRIRFSANRAGIHTVRDMAKASGISKSGVDKIYNLRSFPCFDTLLAMANATGNSVHYWTENLHQEAEFKGAKPVKEEAPKPAPKKRKPKGANKNANGKYECFECGSEYKTVAEVRRCFRGHKTAEKMKQPEATKTAAKPSLMETLEAMKHA